MFKPKQTIDEEESVVGEDWLSFSRSSNHHFRVLVQPLGNNLDTLLGGGVPKRHPQVAGVVLSKMVLSKRRVPHLVQ